MIYFIASVELVAIMALITMIVIELIKSKK